MKKDTHKTKVLFLLEDKEDNEVFALFPAEHYYHKKHPDYNNVFTCHAHIGQHSSCHTDYQKECSPATPEQYKDLFNELESIGYNLEVLNK